MASAASDWLDALFESSPAQTPHQGRSDAALIVCDIGEPDPLVLPWCTDDGEALAGPLHDAAGDAPLICRACRVLGSPACPASTDATPAATAARCGAFAPLPGVTVGRVWLWRVTLLNGHRVWFTFLPERNQRHAIASARECYGNQVTSVTPLPGFDSIP